MAGLPRATEALTSQLDHLVVAAATLADGVQWCERTLGIAPGPGGEHPLMGTHNRIVSIASDAFPDAYLEIIAIHAGAPCARPPGTRRWFDLDEHALQRQLAAGGPRLIHFVARTSQAGASVRALAAQGLDRGELLQASRRTDRGWLRWSITVRPDGQRLFAGALPTLIEWGAVHPAHGLPPSGVRLTAMQASHPQAGALRAAHQAIGLTGVELLQGAPTVRATLQTPRGDVMLDSAGI